MNKSLLIGRLTKDPELRYTQTGVAIARMTLAVNRNFIREGEQQADFIPVAAWQKTAENTAKYLNKGSRVAVEGRIQTSTYDVDGVKRYRTEIIADVIHFLDTKKDREERAVDRGMSQDDFYAEDEIPY